MVANNRGAKDRGNETPDDTLTNLLRGTMAGIVRRDQPDLSARQLAIFLICYLNEPPHTVRGLAVHLNVSRPAITRALDRLAQFDLVRRKPDPVDRRSVLIQRTPAGNVFLRELRSIMSNAAFPKSPPKQAKPRRRLTAGSAA